MIGAYLLLFAAAVAIAAPRVLDRARWVYRSPLLGIAAWYAVLAAVTSALFAAMASAVAPWQPGDAPVCVLWRWCAHAARGGFGAHGRVGAVIVLLVASTLATRVIACGARLARAASARRQEHLQMLALAGRPSAALGATVVEYAEPAAYVLAGADRRVVVTTAALDALTTDELAAVLAHERAHAAGRHDLLLGGVGLLQVAFPGVPLVAVARAQLSRLVEMRADEVAAAGHPRIALARALVVMAGAATTAAATASVSAQVPVGAVAATGGDAAERLRRLLAPPPSLTGLQHLVLVAGIAALAVAPAVLLAAARAFPVLAMCPPLSL